MTTWHLGTMGFSYADWQGPFYPAHIASRDYLKHYSRFFDAVEVDSTFYGIPRPERVIRWKAITPPLFKFCAKVPRTITHELRLSGVAAGEVLKQFIDVMCMLEDKLGVLLIQFPPDFSATEQGILESFISKLPTGIRFAVEFRHPSWYTSETPKLLTDHSVCWAATDYRNLPQIIHKTTGFTYIRWIGWHGRFSQHDRTQIDVSDKLNNWKNRIAPILMDVDTIYGFFNNDYAGHAPETCNHFKDLFGLPRKKWQIPQQKKLF